ncbi:MAG TPA: copper chaperone PCu(A)C [Chloroflexi bacterium]|nr:copper chaperone PCu(A)C [Chloroflexota bacterium]
MKRIAFLTTLALVLVLTACGGSKSLTVQNVWARPGVGGQNSAVYFVIDNPGGQADNLLDASSDIADAVELHKSEMGDNGEMKMIHQEKIPVPAKGQVEFKPGGFHVMLIGLKRDLNPGDTFQVTLHFEKAGDITLDVPVKQP